VSGLEGERTGPSYTWDTLDAYRRREPGRELFFVLGAGDLLTLPEWRRGRELVELAGLAVLPRQGAGLEQVRGFLREFWPGAEPCDPPRGPADTARAAWRFPSGTRLVYLDAPRLEISGTLVRRRWHAGRSLAGLVPESVLAELRARRADVDAAWAQS
jgi:nicotinate-nucleotide adenylyltransferase